MHVLNSSRFFCFLWVNRVLQEIHTHYVLYTLKKCDTQTERKDMCLHCIYYIIKKIISIFKIVYNALY